jgi:urea transporter
MAPPALPADVPMAGLSPLPSLANAGQSILMGFSQVFLVGDAGAGAVILCGVMVGSRSAAWLATLGATTGFVAALVCGAPADMVAAGLYSFSPALAAIALGTVFVNPSGRAVWVACAAALVTVFVHAGLTVVLSPLGIPPLTAPFVLATWCFLLGRRSAV